MNEWPVLTEDGDPDGYVFAADEAEALAVARDELGCEERKPRQTRATVPDGYRVELGYMATLGVVDEAGRVRCPACSRFCRIEDFGGAPTSMRMAGAHVCYAPRCWRCRGLGAAPYAGRAMVRRTFGGDA